jgi:hypothetical protein
MWGFASRGRTITMMRAAPCVLTFVNRETLPKTLQTGGVRP